jgi:hypothetical protein
MRGQQVTLADLTARAANLEPDALRVLCRIAERLAMGRHQYGPLQLATDRRDWREEAAQELLDGCVYLAALALDDDSRRTTERAPAVFCTETEE